MALIKVMTTLPFELFKQRLEEHLLEIEWTIYHWTKGNGAPTLSAIFKNFMYLFYFGIINV